MYSKKHTPQESLDRIKLMMKYDTSKTLNENAATIKKPINEVAPLVIPAITIAAPWLWATGAAAVGAIGTWIYNVQGGGDAFVKTQAFLQGCSSLDKNLKPTQGKADHRAAADSIYNAIQGIGTDEDAIKSAISSMKSVADLCAMAKYYDKTYGDLYDDLDSDIDGEDFRKYVWSAIAPIVDDAEEDLAKAKEKEEGKKTDNTKPEDGGKKKTGGGSSFKSCSGTYTRGCKSDVIKQVQACLGMAAKYQTGNFGPITQAELAKVGKSYSSKFTDADVATICKKQPTQPTKPAGVEDLEDDKNASTQTEFK